MQQIFNFIFKNSNRLLFLLLLCISLSLTIQSHSYHKSRIISSANYVSGGVYEKIHNVSEYLHLKTQNDALAIENARLKSLLFKTKDSTAIQKFQNLKIHVPEDVMVSKVIHNSYNVHENFLTLNSGSLEGVEPDMGVINNLGIVGIVDKTSAHYATVISILNVKSQINAKVKKSNHFGSLVWNGKSTGFVQLIDVPRLASVRKGDTIVTGGQSVIFPENINIGTINKVYIDNKTNYYTLDVKLFNDMTNLGHVYVIKSKNRDELNNLEKTTKNE
ncbi:rod shape-determining protein MreC [Flavobacterium crassostreae]|uniref:Cell shape-determining protein MreC n=1 Tax=Flavobacterium crassostreae TaxID=1763534 RepID=A0A1B9DZR6_9FLAO|nr:rod shape-determining protein MreC [Flavobacterium crassostreae]OCB75192.1 rod shape-determining protein MreC [Flavobacterium crassostreae]